MSRGQNHAFEVHLHIVVPLIWINLGYRLTKAVADIVIQDIETPISFNNRFNQLQAIIVVSYINLNGAGYSPFGSIP